MKKQAASRAFGKEKSVSSRSCFTSLHRFGRHLAAYGVQTYLSFLPRSFFLTRPARRTVSVPPGTAEERLAAALESTGSAPALSFARFLALYPEYAGTAAPFLARLKNLPLPSRSPEEIGRLPDGAEEQRRELLAFLYGAAARLDRKRKSRDAGAFIEMFERFSAAETDMRLEGASMERFRDNFYEDDLFSVPEIDWIRTSEKTLYAVEMPEMRPPARRDAGTASRLARIFALMIFRDGFFVPFDSGNWGLSADGRLFLKRCPVSVRLSAPERRFLSFFLPALQKRDFPQAAKALFKAGFLPPLTSLLTLSRTLEATAEAAEASSAAVRAEHLSGVLTKAGVCLPPSMRVLKNLLKDMEDFGGEHVWENAADVYADYVSRGEHVFAEKAGEFLSPSLAMPELRALSNSVRGRKMNNFVTDPAKIPEMIKRGETGYAFRPRKTSPDWKIIVPLLALAALLWARFS